MGYTTDFEGEFKLDRPLSIAQYNYLNAFADTRRMKRDNTKLLSMNDPKRKAVGLPLGDEGEYFVGGKGFLGQSEDESIINGNRPPKNQPSLWCKWVPSENREFIIWNYEEKFYYYIEWLEYIIENFLKPWGHNLNGEVEWEGEESSDMGKIIVKDNKVTIKKAVISYE